MSEQRYTNRLIHETSPYLLQHAHNPVDWYPWCAEALERARAEDKPILLSIGYSACHWCHVMEHESFEDERTAQVMNAHFVNIKVDREERPDLDSVYMTAVQAMTGGGGWPMTVFLTPAGVPFYGGTYFPPEDRHGLPAFTRVLEGIADAYANRRDELLAAGSKLVVHMREAADMRHTAGALSTALLDQACAALQQQFDAQHGGFGGAPKFPQPMTLEFLLRYVQRTNDAQARTMVDTTLRAMAYGGIYDQLGGGFHRYSVDDVWLVPHFEKMLYDNALLARVYLEAYQWSHEPLYRRIAEETLDYLVRDMRLATGGFCATQDADSEGEEGKYFVWSAEEVRKLLRRQAMIFSQIFDITERGNFEGKNILRLLRHPADVARVTGMSLEAIEHLIVQGRATLCAARAQRIPPGRDDKVLTAWNGMALRAFAQAAVILERDDYRTIAQECAEFLLRELRRDDAQGALVLRTWKDGRAGATHGFLEDYALLADGLLALYEADFDPRWLYEARLLTDSILTRFWDVQRGGLYDNANDHETLIVRPRDTGDNATPSGHSATADVLLRLAVIFDNPSYRARAETILSELASLITRYPTSFGRALAAIEFALAPTTEIALIGDPQAADMQALLAVIRRPFLPHKVILHKHPQDESTPIASPLLTDRPALDGRATAYVCERYTCQRPVTDPDALHAQITGT